MWNEDQKVVFEIGHKKTKVFIKNFGLLVPFLKKNPEFNEHFKFKLDKSPVVPHRVHGVHGALVPLHVHDERKLQQVT